MRDACVREQAHMILYTSGTTGRPKGVYRAQPVVAPQGIYAMRGYDHETSVQLCAGPAYHAAPLAFDVRAAPSMIRAVMAASMPQGPFGIPVRRAARGRRPRM